MTATPKQGAVKKARATTRKTAPKKKAIKRAPAKKAAPKKAKPRKAATAPQKPQDETTAVTGRDGSIYETLMIVEDPDGREDRHAEIRALAQQILEEVIYPEFTPEQIAEDHGEGRKRTGPKSKYRPQWMLQTVLTMMIEGASRTEVIAALMISHETLMQWTDQTGEYYKPVFTETMIVAERLSKAWWLRQGRLKLNDPKFNYRGWFMNMGNRFGWRTNHEISGDPERPVGVNHSGEVKYKTDWEAIDKAMKGKA